MIANLMATIVAMAAANAAPQSVPPISYQASLTIIEQNGDDRMATSAVNVIPLADGPIVAGSRVGGGEALLSGSLRLNEAAGSAIADLTVCHPRGEACVLVARPSLAFAVGDTAVFHVETANFKMTVELAPYAQ